ncbi:hypothetical protein S7335_835 [Synechococcus sp. PCC 7335]|uniref:hypothetical protein n=1 Tax=Synechococcus sp. (strain ATCC 29403 / PCC 7335) TaxID=91464 RepID=UPI00017EBD02|nr:hypothetical protein [Synechococcus sp. PCC 7335]EDX82389.1 hypothetical protein S7335_835 [Synechococcus sp. PCC 7335]
MSVKKMPKRTTIRIPDTLVTDIERWAQARGQGFATVCALAVEMGVKQAKETGELPSSEAESLSKQEEKDS